MKKLLYLILIPTLVFASNSPFSRVRVTKYDADGTPSEEVNDVVICLERSPTSAEKKNYEDVLGYYADGLYEATNGANFIGNVIIYTNGRYCSSADITWNKGELWPGASGHWSLTGGGIGVSDIWRYPGTTIDVPKMDTDQNRFDFGITLVHETMHYRYGIDDDYSKTQLRPSYLNYLIKIEADPEKNRIIISNAKPGLDLDNFPTQFTNIVSPFSASVPVYFFEDIDDKDVTGRIPNGLPIGTILNERASDEVGIPNGWLVKDYAIIDEVDVSRLSEGIYSFNLKDVHGKRIDIKDAGTGMWGIDRPDNVSVAHSLMNQQYDVAKSRACDANNIQWQWANLGTSFNTNSASPMGICCRDDNNGNILSGWDAVTLNPDYESVHGQSQKGRNFRYWYRSLIKKKPTETDIFRAKSFLKNYDPGTGFVTKGHAAWMRDETCGNESTYDLPFMKVELAGRSPAEYQKDTRKHLNIQWVENPKVETIVLIDRSPSMGDIIYDPNNNPKKKDNGQYLLKMDQALQAAKFVSQGFLSALPKPGMGQPNQAKYDVSNVSVGVFAFTHNLFDIYPLTSDPDINDIRTKIDAVTYSTTGGTALFDAIIEMEKKFSSDPSSLKMLYVVSDGLDMMSTHSKDEVVRLYRNRNIAIHSFAYGRADKKLLSSLASETNGIYYENEDKLPLKVGDAASAVLSSFPGSYQLKSVTLPAKATSAEMYIPPRTKHVKILGSYTGTNEPSPIDVVSKTGAILSIMTTDHSISSDNNFVAEIDSLTLSKLSEPYIKVKNKLDKTQLSFRVMATNEYNEHSINVAMTPTGPFEWPASKSFIASVRGSGGLLAEVTASGKLINPDGSVRNITLHDDGLNGDYLAGDGVYFADLPSISQNGTYQWEICMSNKNGKAHTTRIGPSLPDTIPFVEKTDTTPFELFHNGQFVVSGCCSDESTNNLIELYPEKRVNAYLQSGSDEDRFKIVGTLSGKSYALYLSSRNLDSFNNIKVYSPTDLTTPVYTMNAEPKNGLISIPLSSEYAKPGFVVEVSGSSATGTNYDLILLERNYSVFAIGRFEQESDWHSEHTTLALDSKRKNEGIRSLVTPAGWKIIESRNISTSDFELVGKKMSMDVFVPVNTQNKYWIGTVELWLSVPSSNKRVQLGSQQQIQAYLGGWKSYEFNVNDEARHILAEQHNDARFQIVLNTADSLWIDNLRFSGDLLDNPVNKTDPVCPGSSGCNVVEPIQLRINESVRVVADGDVYIEIVGFPTNWTPEKVKIGLAAEDGSPMTGTLVFDGGAYPLSDWYLEKRFKFTRGKRYLFKLHNASGRLYRISAWTEGLARDIALADGFFNSIWNVKF